MKCPFCGGSGKRKTWVSTDTLSEYEQPCFKCHGKGEIEQTNEEWFCNLTIKDKARVFSNMLFEAWKDGLAEEMHDKEFYEDLIGFWLSEVYNGQTRSITH